MALGDKEGEEQKRIKNLNSSIEAILHQYPKITEKIRKDLIKKLEKDNKRYAENWIKTGYAINNSKIARNDIRIEKLKKADDRLTIKYPTMSYEIKESYFRSLTDKEGTLDKGFARGLIKVLRETHAPRNETEAKILESLIELYSKKISNREYYDIETVENSVNKLTNFQNNVISEWETSDYTDFLKFRREKRYDAEYSDYDDEDFYELWLEEGGNEMNVTTYEAVASPMLVDGYLIGINFIFI